MSFRTPWLSMFLVLVGCSSPNPGSHAVSNQVGTGGGNVPTNSASAGGRSGSGGSGGSALGGAWSNPGLAGSGGSAGGGSMTGGAPSSGGAGGGSAGTAFGNSAGGSGGSSSNGGSSGSGGALGRGPAPTFTMIYNTIITTSCGGAQCHLKRPTPFGYDFSSKSAASAAWRSDVIPGDGEGSPMFQVLNFGIMPKDKPTLSVENLFMVLDWINAGALDN